MRHVHAAGMQENIMSRSDKFTIMPVEHKQQWETGAFRCPRGVHADM